MSPENISSKSKRKKGILYMVIGVLILAFALIGWWWNQGQVRIITDRSEYSKNGILRINVKNKLPESVCFSSRYPYYLQKKEGVWKNYQYGEAQEEDIAAFCIKGGDLKGFGIYLFSYDIKSAVHRLVLPACIGCKEGDSFNPEKTFYSNQFRIQ
ncbi:MAG: hypothetical protein COS24_02490 [Candidatus Nealsonbacteria bacterium CG02_land_8_20_14_3_00_34_20]|uniref:Uncharacterized protein n=2 Tax=Candidatus Nealsoniibacteriota TaxID=1817911 RepID=A0A2M7DAF7_9BACT|nr:MAG: hypothetical protein COV62_02170 [Candidatus Nealsonbacteria bacterium CG11_big_fil_rev_8_21_14_0_20_35_11]PIV45410.1 MAG: hypothetical protein COS24_02490 [Candidatus Nealsonbacteria bacterium CG02_land_8_20_14_3_00_34_20]